MKITLSKSKRVFALMCAALVVLLLAGCGAAPNDTAAQSTAAYNTGEQNTVPALEPMVTEDTETLEDVEVAYAPPPQAPATGGAGNAEGEANEGSGENETAPSTEGTGTQTNMETPQNGRKVILNADIYMETLEYEETMASLRRSISAAGGFTASATEQAPGSSNRSATITARIPSQNYTSFMESASTAGNITYRNEYSQDITAQYMDVEARITALRTQETRLLELMAQADSMEDILTIQNQLTDVQYQIEYYTSTQRTYDDLVAYSTITITVDEVREWTPEEPDTFGSRVLEALRNAWHGTVDFFKGLLITLIYLLPVLIIGGAILAFVLFLTRKKRRERREQKAAIKKYNQQMAEAYKQASSAASQTTTPITQQSKDNKK